MRRPSSVLLFALFALATPAFATIDPAADTLHVGFASVAVNEWYRIDFRTARTPLRNAAQVKIAIQTKGPRMQGLIRIPGAPASNFDTGNGLTEVDLINATNGGGGNAGMLAVEILFTQTTRGQFYEVFPVDDGERAE